MIWGGCRWVYGSFPSHSALEVEQLVATPLEKLPYQIDGVQYVASMAGENQAIVTVGFYVGEDRDTTETRRGSTVRCPAGQLGMAATARLAAARTCCWSGPRAWHCISELPAPGHPAHSVRNSQILLPVP
jgi:hypothetical protein